LKDPGFKGLAITVLLLTGRKVCPKTAREGKGGGKIGKGGELSKGPRCKQFKGRQEILTQAIMEPEEGKGRTGCLEKRYRAQAKGGEKKRERWGGERSAAKKNERGEILFVTWGKGEAVGKICLERSWKTLCKSATRRKRRKGPKQPAAGKKGHRKEKSIHEKKFRMRKREKGLIIWNSYGGTTSFRSRK